jgi:hypothetical protein
MSRGEKAPAASTPVRTPEMAARKLVIRGSTMVSHRGSCWPVRLRRYPHDEAVTCTSWRAPLVAEASPLLRRITRASTVGTLPSIHYFRWASALELELLVPGHRRHGGKLETVSMSPRLAAGLPSLPPDTSGRVRFDLVMGTLEERRSTTCEDPGPTFHTIARAAGQTFRLPSPPRPEGLDGC